MFAYVARQAILDRDKNVLGYELLFRDGKQNCFPNVAPDEATPKILASNHLTLGLDEITGGKLSFINFYEDTLLYRFPTSLDPMAVVIEIVETAPISKELLAACKHIKQLGYRLALDDHDFDPKWDVFLPYIDIIKVDIRESDYETIKKHVPKFLDAKVKLIAEKVETYEEYELYRDLGCHYFQGYFYARPEVIKQKNIPNNKLSLLELIGESAKSEMNFDRINDIIERDVALSYMLLRFINNPTINKRNKISSLRHALNYMGEVELKKFIALLALANLGDAKPMELLQVSLIRAKFCELLAAHRHDPENPPKGFLVGLFSLIDAMLDREMTNLMENLPLSDDLKAALCGEKNNLLFYLELAKTFESANWARTRKLSQSLKVEQKVLHGIYNQAVVWSNAMRQSIG
ncbi:EAL and HDOD domain-containing protein [Planctobacterium marinum]|uniref:Histidine kinase n=1 Tax=Planctobacterium marinum TaxID=1631968 RepID=A0AA48HU90_9ALTE|nr:histidine kinase [Planctobacterium marinum]